MARTWPGDGGRKPGQPQRPRLRRGHPPGPGGQGVLHVGAFDSFAEAEKARGRVANAPGPNGRQTPYSGAYVVNIPR